MSAWLLLGGAAGLAYAARDHMRTPYDSEFKSAALAYDVPVGLLKAIARRESGMNPAAVGPLNSNGTRDYGIMQVNERTARNMGFDPLKMPSDVRLGIRGGAAYLSAVWREIPVSRRSAFTWAMAYNVGPDLKPEAVGEAYAKDVTWHWTLYDVGGLFA